MKRTTIFIILCVVSLFCFAQNGQKDSTITTVQLGDVVVKGRIPEVRTKGAVSKIQVDKTVLAKMGTVARMLAHTPGLHSVNGNIEVNGLGEPNYVLDGRRLSDAKELSTLQADNIKSIEIDRAPSVKYSPNGQPVIYISTIKHVNDYMFLSLGDYLKQTRMFTDAGILNVRSQYKKFSTSLSYMGGKDANKNKETYFRDVYRDNIFSIAQKRETPVSTYAHKVDFSTDYQLNEKSRLGFYYFFQFNNEDNKALGTNLTSWLGKNDEKQISRKGKNYENIHSGTLQYAYTCKKYSLTVSQEIASNNERLNNQTLESNDNYSSLTKSHANRKYTVLTTSIDNAFLLPWKVKGSAGALFNYVNSKANTNSEIPYFDVQDYLNDVKVKESNPQVYLMLSKTFGKWTFIPAARYQYIYRNISTIYGTDPEESLHQHFSTLCPVMTIKYSPNDNWFFQFNYRRSLIQPNFSQINSGLVYQDSLLYSRGNTDLKNESIDRYTFSSTWRDLTLSLRYTYHKNPLVNVLQPMASNSNILSSYSLNMKKASDFRVTLDYSKTLGNLELSCEGEVVFPHSEYEFEGQKFNRNKVTFNGQANINFALTPTIYLFTDYTYQGINEYLLYSQKEVHSWNMGVTASLLDERLNINLAVNDILGKANYNNIHYLYNNVGWGTRGKNDMRGVELTVSYTLFNKEVNVRASRKNENIIQRTM